MGNARRVSHVVILSLASLFQSKPAILVHHTKRVSVPLEACIDGARRRRDRRTDAGRRKVVLLEASRASHLPILRTSGRKSPVLHDANLYIRSVE